MRATNSWPERCRFRQQGKYPPSLMAAKDSGFLGCDVDLTNPVPPESLPILRVFERAFILAHEVAAIPIAGAMGQGKPDNGCL
jgi:hypothetical protein